MRLCCIDIGSNTTRLLVADAPSQGAGPLIPVLSERVFLPLTQIEQGDPLARKRLGTLLEVVARLAAQAIEVGVGPGATVAVATQALRALPDTERPDLLASLSRSVGVEVELLTAEREANLAFAGATLCADPRAGTVGVIDIGGGSTELIVGAPRSEPVWWCSVPLGSRVLTEQYLPSDPPIGAELQAASAAAEAAFRGNNPPCNPRRVWTVGGGTQSLGRLLGDRPADRRSLTDTLWTLTAAPAIEVAAAHGLDEQRTRMLPAALVMLRAATVVLGRVAEPGTGGVREGAIAERAAHLRDGHYG